MQNLSKAPQRKGKPYFLLHIIFHFSFYLFREKTTGVAEVEFLSLVCGVSAHGCFITIICVRDGEVRLAPALAAEWEQQHSLTHVLPVTCCLFTGLVSSLSVGWYSPLCSSSRCVWGTMDDSRLLEWSLYGRAFNALPVISRAIIETPLSSQFMIYSPPGGRDAPFQSVMYRAPSSPPATHGWSPRRWGPLSASRLPDNRTDTGVWRASFQRNYCRIKRANREEKWVSAACQCHKSSLTNRPETGNFQLALQIRATFQLKKKNKNTKNKTKLTTLLPQWTSLFSALISFFIRTFWSLDMVELWRIISWTVGREQVELPWQKNERWEAARIRGFVLRSAMCSAANEVLLDSIFALPTGFIPKYPLQHHIYEHRSQKMNKLEIHRTKITIASNIWLYLTLFYKAPFECIKHWI